MSNTGYISLTENDLAAEGDEVLLTTGEWRKIESAAFGRKGWPGRQYRRPVPGVHPWSWIEEATTSQERSERLIQRGLELQRLEAKTLDQIAWTEGMIRMHEVRP